MPIVENLSPNGELFLSENGEIEKFNLRSSRLSIIQKDNFYLLNFWVESTGPVLEILTRIDELPQDNIMFDVKVPALEVCKKQWDEVYSTCYYNGFHQHLEFAELKIIKKGREYLIGFSVVPDEEKVKVSGNCSLELQDEIERYF